MNISSGEGARARAISVGVACGARHRAPQPGSPGWQPAERWGLPVHAQDVGKRMGKRSSSLRQRGKGSRGSGRSTSSYYSRGGLDQAGSRGRKHPMAAGNEGADPEGVVGAPNTEGWKRKGMEERGASQEARRDGFLLQFAAFCIDSALVNGGRTRGERTWRQRRWTKAASATRGRGSGAWRAWRAFQGNVGRNATMEAGARRLYSSLWTGEERTVRIVVTDAYSNSWGR